MKNQEDNSRGEWYVLVQVLLLFAVLFAPELEPERAIPAEPLVTAARIFGGILCVTGLAFSFLGLLRLGKNLSIFPKPKNDSELVESGAYAIVRHPIYCGLIAAAFGWSLFRWSLLALIVSAALVVLFDLKSRREEQWLESKFAEYAEYKQHVKKLIPFVY